VLHAPAIEHGIAAVCDQGSVEVGAEKADFWRHRDGNLGIDVATAIFAFAIAPEDRRDKVNRIMKSAYELAMERLEKKTPSVALTNEQKQQIAEIDSTFKARMAEKELFLKEQISKAVTAGNAEEAESLQKQLTIDLHRLHEDAETKKEKLRASFLT
jgi:hypothetical protein